MPPDINWRFVANHLISAAEAKLKELQVETSPTFASALALECRLYTTLATALYAGLQETTPDEYLRSPPTAVVRAALNQQTKAE